MQPIERRIFFILILVAGLAWIGISAHPPETKADMVPAPQVGFLAPDFTLKTPLGESFTLSDLRGHPVIINLWATWCPPCRAEMPAIQKLYDEYKEQGLMVLAINATNQDDAMAVAPFVDQYQLTFPILLDETGRVSRSYQLRSLPSSYFIGRDGVVRDVVIGGPMPEALLRAQVEALLK